jgi:hypothetical protein
LIIRVIQDFVVARFSCPYFECGQWASVPSEKVTEGVQTSTIRDPMSILGGVSVFGVSTAGFGSGVFGVWSFLSAARVARDFRALAILVGVLTLVWFSVVVIFPF